MLGECPVIGATEGPSAIWQLLRCIFGHARGSFLLSARQQWGPCPPSLLAGQCVGCSTHGEWRSPESLDYPRAWDTAGCPTTSSAGLKVKELHS